MKYLVTMLITTLFSSSLLSMESKQLIILENKAQPTIPENTKIYLQAFSNKINLIPVPHHIANICQTLRDPIIEHPEINSFTLPINESVEVINGAINFLLFAYPDHSSSQKNVAYLKSNASNRLLNNPSNNENLREKKIEHFISKYTKNTKELIAMCNLILYLNPCENDDENTQQSTKKPLIQLICEKSLLNNVISNESNRPNHFSALNPDINISTENVSAFIKTTSLVAHLLSAYFVNQQDLQQNKSHPILGKETLDISTVFYCTNDCAIYLLEDPEQEEHYKITKNNITKLFKGNKKLIKKVTSKDDGKAYQYTLKSTGAVSTVCINDTGSIFICACTDDNNPNTLLLPEDDKLAFFEDTKDYKFSVSNQKIYNVHSSGIVNVFNNNIFQFLQTLPNFTVSSSIEITNDMHDSLLVCKKGNDLFIIDLIKAATQASPIEIDKLLQLDKHSFTIEKISLHPQGEWLYLLINRSNGSRDDYVYNLCTRKLERLLNIAKNYTISTIEWSPSFVIRSYINNDSEKPKTDYAISHLNTANSWITTVPKSFFCLSKNGSSYIEKNTQDNKTTYTTVPLVTETIEKIGQFFNGPLSFSVALLLDKLVYNIQLDNYEYDLYNKHIPEEIKNIFTSQEKK